MWARVVKGYDEPYFVCTPIAMSAFRRKGRAPNLSSNPSVAGEEKLRVVALPIECSLDMRTFVSDMTRLGTTPPLKSGAAGEVGASPLAPGPRLRPWDPWVSLRSNCGRLWGLREGDRPAPTNPSTTVGEGRPVEGFIENWGKPMREVAADSSCVFPGFICPVGTTVVGDSTCWMGCTWTDMASGAVLPRSLVRSLVLTGEKGGKGTALPSPTAPAGRYGGEDACRGGSGMLTAMPEGDEDGPTAPLP